MIAHMDVDRPEDDPRWLGLALTGVTVIVFVAVAGTTAGLIAGACALALFTCFWWLLPLSLRTHGG